MNSPEASPDTYADPVAQLIELSRKPSCTPEELKAAYLRLAQQLHPDHGGDARQFQRLQSEYRAALSRLKLGYDISNCSSEFVPMPVESRTLNREHVMYMIGIALMALVLAGLTLPPATSFTVACCIGSALILLLFPLVMASAKPYVICLILVVVVPISLATFVILLQVTLFPRVSEGQFEMRDVAVASITLPAVAMLIGSFVGVLFWMSGDRSQF